MRESMEAEGWRESDPAKIWGEIICDGHNRVRIAQELGITDIPCTPLYFKDESECRVWMYRNQLGRRNLTDSLRALYAGRLIQELKGEMGTTAAVRHIAAQEGISERTGFRGLEVADSFERADTELQEDFLSGNLSAAKLIEALKPVVVPPPEPILTKEEMEEKARADFVHTVRQVAERTAIGIRNLRYLCGDVEIVFRNRGEDLVQFAPEIAKGMQSWKELEVEAMKLELITYVDGVYRIPDELPEI